MSDPTEELPPVLPGRASRFVSEEELYDAFRETFLVEILNPELHAVIRTFGQALGSMATVDNQRWPYRHVDATAYRLQAGAAELRHLQSFFASWGEGETEVRLSSDTSKQHYELCQLAMQVAKKLGRLADDLEKAVGDWKFGSRGSD